MRLPHEVCPTTPEHKADPSVLHLQKLSGLCRALFVTQRQPSLLPEWKPADVEQGLVRGSRLEQLCSRTQFLEAWTSGSGQRSHLLAMGSERPVFDVFYRPDLEGSNGCSIIGGNNHAGHGFEASATCQSANALLNMLVDFVCAVLYRIYCT